MKNFHFRSSFVTYPTFEYFIQQSEVEKSLIFDLLSFFVQFTKKFQSCRHKTPEEMKIIFFRAINHETGVENRSSVIRESIDCMQRLILYLVSPYIQPSHCRAKKILVNFPIVNELKFSNLFMQHRRTCDRSRARPFASSSNKSFLRLFCCFMLSKIEQKLFSRMRDFK